MGRHKKNPTAEPTAEEIELQQLASGAGPDEAINDLEAKEIRSLAEAVSKFGSECTIAKIYRKTPQDPKFRYVDALSVESVSEDYIAKEFGGGDYEVQFIGSRGLLVSKRRVSIDQRIKGARDMANQPKSDATAGDALVAAVKQLGERTTDPGTPTSFVEMMQLQLQAQQQAAAAAQAQFSQMLQMQQAANQANISMMAEAFKARPAAENGKSTLTELAGLFLPVVMEMIKKKTSPMESLEVIARVKELFADQPDKEDMLDKIIKYGGPLAAGLMGKMGAPQQLNPATETAQQEQPTAPPPPQPAAPGVQEQMFLAMLLNGARKNSDVGSYATMIEDGTDEVTYRRLIDTLQKPDWFEALFGSLPPFAEHRAWLAELRNELLDPRPPDDAAPGIPTEKTT